MAGILGRFLRALGALFRGHPEDRALRQARKTFRRVRARRSRERRLLLDATTRLAASLGDLERQRAATATRIAALERQREEHHLTPQQVGEMRELLAHGERLGEKIASYGEALSHYRQRTVEIADELARLDREEAVTIADLTACREIVRMGRSIDPKQDAEDREQLAAVARQRREQRSRILVAESLRREFGDHESSEINIIDLLKEAEDSERRQSRGNSADDRLAQ